MPSPRSGSLPPALGPFRLIARLGQGGFAPVWRAEEVYDGKRLRDVAVKLFFLPPDIAPASPEAARWHDQVIDEARALCRVEHPNIVRFHALHRDDAEGIVGLVMEHVAGKNLGVLLRGLGPLEEAKGRLDRREPGAASSGDVRAAAQGPDLCRGPPARRCRRTLDWRARAEPRPGASAGPGCGADRGRW